MRCLSANGESRREFFRAGARYCLLGALALAGWAFSGPGSTGRRCINRSICNGCLAFTQCDLPPALSARQAQAPGRVGSGGKQGG